MDNLEDQAKENDEILSYLLRLFDLLPPPRAWNQVQLSYLFKKFLTLVWLELSPVQELPVLRDHR